MQPKRMDSRREPGTPLQFSAVIPTYNRADTVCRAIDSILSQTYSPGEIVVVDDGSRDATAQRVRSYGERIRYVFQENAGAAAARNRGATEAMYPWIAFLDSDDLWAPGYLEHMAAAIAGTAGAAALYFSDADFEAFAPPKNWWARVGFVAQAPFELVESPLDVVLAEGQPMLLPFSVFLRSAFLAEGGLWESLSAGEDTHLYVRLGMTRRICAVSFSGGIVKGEPEGSGRLTSAFGPGSLKHWDCSILLWNDILRRFKGPLLPLHRRLLSRRVADAYWRKGILSAKQHRLLIAATSLGISFIRDPSIALGSAIRKLHTRA
jgi:glycosyltransferase involved in cell wall biosynthesis